MSESTLSRSSRGFLTGQETTRHSGFLHASFQQGAKHQSWHRTVHWYPKQGCKGHFRQTFSTSSASFASFSRRSCHKRQVCHQIFAVINQDTKHQQPLRVLSLQISNIVLCYIYIYIQSLNICIILYYDIFNLLFPPPRHTNLYTMDSNLSDQRSCHSSATQRYPAQCTSTSWS